MKIILTVSQAVLIIIASVGITVNADSAKPIIAKAQNLAIKSPKLKPYNYNVFYKVYKGKVVYFEMIKTKNGHSRLKMYPYGKAKARLGSARPVISSNKFLPYIRSLAAKEKMEAKRPIKVLNAANAKNDKGILSGRSSSTPITTGIGMGYNQSTGYINAESTCFNATTSYDNNISSSSLSSSNTASSFSQQWKVSSSISGSYDGFSASNSFTFQDSYENSGNAGQIYYNAYSTYLLKNTLQTSDPLNDYGDEQQQGGTFTLDCGSYFVNSVTAGILITTQFYWSSSDTSVSGKISDMVTGSDTTLVSTADAISYAFKKTSTTTSFEFNDQVYGGAASGSNTIAAAISGNSDESTCLETGSSSACTSYFTAVNTVVNTVISDFNASVPTNAANGNYSNFEAFPHGVAGAITNTKNIFIQPLNTLLSSSGTYTDELLPYTAQLNNYVNILNQVATLYNRASWVDNLVTASYFNPTYYLDISDTYLNTLISAYNADFVILTNYLGVCLNSNQQATGATSQYSGVQSACAPILNLYSQGITNAYQYYAAGGPSTMSSSPNQSLVQQNTIALQYTGTNQTYNLYPGGGVNYSCCNSQVPTDLIWAQTVNSTPAYQSSNPALIAFGDQPYPSVGSGAYYSSNAAFTQIISTSAPQSTMSIPASSYVASDCTVKYSTPGFISCTSGMSYSYANGCSAPTFATPCTILGSITFASGGSSTIMQSLILAPITSFFVE